MICLYLKAKRQISKAGLVLLVVMAFLSFGLRLPSVPPELKTLDFKQEPKYLVDSKVEPAAEENDKCTMILNVFDRISTLRDQLDHYHNFALLDRILVVWNHQTLKPPFKVSPNLLEFNGQKRSIEEEADASVRFLIPVHILPQDVDSLNNRYLPFPQIRTDCVISMDDDYKVPEASLKRLHTLFQNGHRDRLLGFQFVARSYKDVTPGQWAYSFSQKDGYSIVLPSGAMFHRKYLQMYTDLPKRAHEIVDAKMNGEDILFNLMIANATGKPPVIVNAPMFLLDYGKNGGLWKRKKHLEERNWGLTTFVHEIFDGIMPLKRTYEVHGI